MGENAIGASSRTQLSLKFLIYREDAKIAKGKTFLCVLSDFAVESLGLGGDRPVGRCG